MLARPAQPLPWEQPFQWVKPAPPPLFQTEELSQKRHYFRVEAQSAPIHVQRLRLGQRARSIPVDPALELLQARSWVQKPATTLPHRVLLYS